jgi:hypothetical protein
LLLDRFRDCTPDDQQHPPVAEVEHTGVHSTLSLGHRLVVTRFCGVRHKQRNAGTQLANALYGLSRDADEEEL